MEDSQVIEAILALASAVSGKDKTDSQAGSVDAALEVLSSVVSDSSMEGNESIYEAAQFATNRSTDTDSAAGAILALAQYVGGGGGGSATTDVYLWNMSEVEILADAAFDKVLVQTSLDDSGSPLYEQVTFTPITDTFLGFTVHGAKVENVPCGAFIIADIGVSDSATVSTGYGRNGNATDAAGAELISQEPQGIALMPMDGFKCVCSFIFSGSE